MRGLGHSGAATGVIGMRKGRGRSRATRVESEMKRWHGRSRATRTAMAMVMATWRLHKALRRTKV
jgi:hypothetical protein